MQKLIDVFHEYYFEILINFPLSIFERFVEPFSDQIHFWEKTLSLIHEIIDHWIHFTQRKWLYLEGIFASNDARSILPTIATKFDLIDKEYVKVKSNRNLSCLLIV